MVIKQLTPGNSISGSDQKYLKRIPVKKLVKLSSRVSSSYRLASPVSQSWNYISNNNIQTGLRIQQI